MTLVEETQAQGLTDEERSLGFISAFANDSDSGCSFTAAVIRPISESDRVLKLPPDAAHRANYVHQRFGMFCGRAGVPGVVGWYDVADVGLHAQATIEAARKGNVIPVALKIAPSAPQMILNCPGCQTEFAIEAAHLPLDGTQTCPICQATKPTNDFNFYF
jgi:predicted Zn finger-like uncharacterized protein